MAVNMKEQIETYADTLQGQVEEQIQSLLQFRPSTFTIASPGAYPLKEVAFNTPTAPNSPQSDIEPPPPPSIAVPAISTIVTDIPEPFDGVFKTEIPKAPSTLAARTFTMPDVALPAKPTAPWIQTITAPTLTDTMIPAPMPLSDIPVFEASIPEWGTLIDVPYTDNPLTRLSDAAYTKRTYESVELDFISGELQTDIKKGRTGVPEEVESAIWQRQSERDSMALNDAITLTRNTFSKRGFSLPPGKLRKSITRLVEAREILLQERSREIAVKQADLTQSNRQFAITTALQLEQQQMQFTIQYAGLMLDIAKETVNAGIAIYNTHISKMGLELERYKAAASVYESQLRAFSIRIEAYRGELEAAKLRGDLNSQQIDIYKAMLSAQEILIGIYASEINAFTAEASVEKLKVDIFKGEVEAYQVQAQANALEFQAFESLIKGEIAKAQIFEAEVNAYRAKVEAIGESNRAKATQVQAEGARAGAMAEAAKVAVAGYQAEIELAKTRGMLLVEGFKAEVALMAAKGQIETAKVSSEAENHRAAITSWEAVTQAITSRAQIMSQSVNSENTLKVEASKTAAALLQGILNALSAVGIEITKKNA